MLITKTTRIKEIIKNRELSFVFCLLSVIILPVHVEYLPPVIIIWVLCWILENYGRFHEIWDIKKSSVLLFALFAMYFLWYMAGILYSKDFNNGTLLVFRRLSFIVFPLVLFFPGDIIKKKIKLLLKIFSLSTLLYVLFCFGFAFSRSLSFTDGNFIFNPHPTDPQLVYINYFFGTDLAFSQHTTYLAIYILFSIFISFDSFNDSLLKTSFRIFWFITGFILLVSLYFFSSRAGIISALFLIPIYLVIQFKKIKRWWILVLILIVVLPVFISLLLSNERIRYYLPERSETSLVNKFMLDNRIPIWKSAISVIKRNLVLGVGVGDACDELQKEYINDGYTEAYYDNLNAHNQYLEVLLGTGLIGFLIFISILVLMIFIAVTGRNLLFILYISIILIFFLFESILNRLAGVSFFALFSFLLINLDKGHLAQRDSKTKTD